jgi:D-aspartate ligase
VGSRVRGLRPVSERERCPALVFGSGVTQLGVLRALGGSGVTPLAVCDREDFVRRSRWYRPAPRRAEGMPLGEYLGTLQVGRAVLVPCSDYWVTAIAGLGPEYRDRFPASVPPAEAAAILVDKRRFAELLRVLGVPQPHTEPIDSVADLERVPEGVLAGTTFLKPRDSQRFFARFHVKALRVASRADAVARLADIEAAGLGVVLQEYIPGPASQHYYVEGFVDAERQVRIWFARRRLRMYPPDFGNSTYFASVPLDEVSGAVASMTTLLAHLKYRGIFSAEFKLDHRDGEFKLLEVNARPWWYVDFAVRSGADVVTAAYRDALGLPVETVTRYRVGATCMYPYYDYHAYRGDGWTLRKFAAWLGAFLNARQPIFRWSDPRPGLALGAGLVWNQMRKRLGAGAST